MAGQLRLRQLLQVPAACAVPDHDIELLARAEHPDPAGLLGMQCHGGGVVVRCWVSGAEAVSISSDALLPASPDAREDPPSQAVLRRVPGCPSECPWLFEAAFEVQQEAGSLGLEELSRGGAERLRAACKYKLQVTYSAGGSTAWVDPYSLGPLLSEALLRGWASGEPQEPPASMFGAHHLELGPGLWGTRFAVWAPHARAVSVVGDFNFWDGRAHPMCRRDQFGVWEIFLPIWDLRGQKYAYQILPSEGAARVKADAFALEFVDPSDGGHDAKVPQCDDYSRAAWKGGYPWRDGAWLEHRARAFGEETWSSQPLSIYEVHLPSWSSHPDGEAWGYRALAEPLARHVSELGFTAVEFLPLSQYPSDQSWGYQCAAGLYAVDSRLGSPDDFRFLVDTLHGHSIAVFVDFVGAHFAKDDWGLTCYSGAPQFEYDGALGEIPGWGTARFNYAKPEVRAYLLGAAEHWIEQFHVDGLRLDAVAAMVYKSFGREEDGDAILAGRGVINGDGVAFLQGLCARIRERHPGVLLSAEESTNFKWVTCRRAEEGTERVQVKVEDLGFHLKWNMGFTYDTLAFFGTEAAARPRLETFGWKKLAWYLAYAFNERWVLPFSHDNAHGRSLLEQMTAPGEAEIRSQFAHLRMLLAYTIGMPGRPLLFMGTEVGEGAWSYQKAIDWESAKGDPLKQQLRRWVAKLLRLYRELPALHAQADDKEGFSWLDKDAAGRCAYAWRRQAKGARDLVVVVNASTAPLRGYRVALGGAGAVAGPWRCVAATGGAEAEEEAGEEKVSLRGDELTMDLPGCGAQLWLAPDPAAPRRVLFEVRHPGAAPGDSVRLVGGSPELGDWQPSSGPALVASEGDPALWRAEVELPPSLAVVEFKYVTVGPGGDVCWEPFPGNRRAEVQQLEGAQRRVCAEFGRA